MATNDLDYLSSLIAGNPWEDRNYFLSCGCWSGDADHTTCLPQKRNCRGCGVPDDCYCHEMCSDDPCDSCQEEDQRTRDEDHAIAIVMTLGHWEGGLYIVNDWNYAVDFVVHGQGTVTVGGITYGPRNFPF